MKKVLFALVAMLTSFNATCSAQAWAQDPFCLGIIYVDVDTDLFDEPGSELYLSGTIPYGASLSYGCSMQGLGSPNLYSFNSTTFYFSVIKSHLYWEYTFNPDGVFTCELYTGQIGSNGLTSGPLFYMVQYQIADFMD